VQTKTYN